MKYIGILCILLVLMPAFASAEMDMKYKVVSNEDPLISWLEKLEVYVSDANYVDDPYNTYVDPGQSVTYDLVVCNWEINGYYFVADLIILDSNYVGVDAWSSDAVYLNSGTCSQDYYITLPAPNTPGTYKVEATSYYGQTPYNPVPDDTDYFWLHVEGDTPTPDTPTPDTPTEPGNTPPTAKITYIEMGGGKIVLKGVDSTDSDGIIEKYDWHINNEFVNGQSTFTHVFDTAGTYVIQLTVEDDDKATAQAILTVTINENEDTGVVQIASTDASESESTPPSQNTGIWFEDGSLKVPGFESVFSICGLLLVSYLVRRGQQE